jgi:hypothetical protein
MKKQLLLGSALLAAISAFPQNGRVKPTSKVNVKAELLASKYAVEPTQAPRLNIPVQPVDNAPSQEAKTSSMPPTSISWKLIGGASNTYGMLVSRSRPLQYNDNVNAISFIHRKSASYTANPAGNSNSGTIVAEISSNWGATFDSTAIYADASNAGRYPQGAIYAGPGNTNIANAYVVGSGPVVTGSNFTGDWYASKQIGTPGSSVFNNTPDATPNAQQYVPFTLASYPANFQAHSWSRNGFSSTDDGVVRSLALVQNDNTQINPRGVGIVKGTFSAGVFNWSMDSIIPNTTVASNGDKNMGEGQMAWNEAGTVGYVVVPGVLASATGNNQGNQPMIYKTTNSGASWAPLSPIDFNSTAMAPIVAKIYSTNANTNVAIPYMVDWDITVDANNNLHIGAIFWSASSADVDSTYYIQQFQIGADVYKNTHTPGDRPYLYDFVGDGSSPWVYTVIDSFPTEDPGSQTTNGGYNDNPWDPTGTGSAKLNIDPRIQLGRTPDGQFVTYSWTESDTNFTTGQKKYNILPNIKTRLAAIGAGTSMTVSPTEINVSKPASGQGTVNPNVNSRATLHYMSPTTSAATVVTAGSTQTVDIFTPFTVTNSNPYSQLTNNTIWFTAGRLSYAFSSVVTGIENNASAVVANSSIYPNPAKNAATVSIELKNNTNVTVNVYNTIGQLVKTTTAAGQVGSNNINVDLSNLSTGVYIVNVNADSYTSTTKLIVE